MRHFFLHAALLPVLAISGFGADKPADVAFPPRLPDGAASVTESSPEFLKPPAGFPADVAIAKTAPTVDFAFFPGQDYPGKPWSAWGDSLAVNGKYYAAVGDHLAPGNAFVYEYDPLTKRFRQLADVKKLLQLPEGHYTPGKIHSRLDLGSDGWIYCSTHRGSTRITTDANFYKGDWIIRCNPADGKSEIVAHAPVPKHCIPCSVLDGKRLIFYGGTAPGSDSDPLGIQFFAYDIRGRKVLYSGPDGPARYMVFSPSTGRVYFNGSKSGELLRYDPEKGGAPVRIAATIGIRAASDETKDGFVYTVSEGKAGKAPEIYAFNTKTEQAEALGPASVGTQGYIASLDVDPTGRYLYYVPGAHGGSDKDGGAVVQFDVKTKTRKVLAFLSPSFTQKYGNTLKGTYSTAIDPAGDKLYITWNNSRGTKAWDSVLVTVVHIPDSERKP